MHSILIDFCCIIDRRDFGWPGDRSDSHFLSYRILSSAFSEGKAHQKAIIHFAKCPITTKHCKYLLN